MEEVQLEGSGGDAASVPFQMVVCTDGAPRRVWLEADVEQEADAVARVHPDQA
eukprot:CAMPEP_0180255892 /NCGR_PEP_ID=MMETSP0987-20121128/40983_1 /TAXON_ID=697907 /ORGANISM="non described non described, Strain CCMP2293" /LENGTH=52 /DNA_ID=CAMNT_0022225071 /DNA_START=93 /DNA_END=251 /DNA_ORIENTATION=-